MSVLASIGSGLRYAADVRRFLRHTISVDEARGIVERRLAERQQAFLRTVEQGIFARPESPYATLLRHARLDFSDVSRLVGEVGIEGALERLYDAGVYVTLEELKGRQPVIRKGLEFAVAPEDFSNPFVSAGTFQVQSSGSRGAPARGAVDFDYVHNEAIYLSICLAAHRLLDRPFACQGIGSPLVPLAFAKIGRPLDKYFSGITTRLSAERLRPMLLAKLTVFATALLKGRVSNPEFSLQNQTLAAARWLAARKAQGSPALMLAFATPATRICLAAKEQGLDISGTVFRTSGEPFTPGKAEVLAGAGTRAIVTYVMSETGSVGVSCASPSGLDDLHIFTDRFAVLQRDKLTSSGESVGALVYTTLAPSGTRLLFNVESGDYGILQQRDCGCLMGDMGLSSHISEIRSYEKLTSEGVTFIGSRVHDLVEELLPARFGGHGFDYQLVEEEGEAGAPKVSIAVSPGVGIIDDDALVATVLQALSRSPMGDPLWAGLWAQGQTLRVLRREPYKTRTSKVLPLHILRDESQANEIVSR